MKARGMVPAGLPCQDGSVEKLSFLPNAISAFRVFTEPHLVGAVCREITAADLFDLVIFKQAGFICQGAFY